MAGSDNLMIGRYGHGRWAMPARTDTAILITSVLKGTASVLVPALGRLTEDDVLVTRLDVPITFTVDPFSVVITTRLAVSGHDFAMLDRPVHLRADARTASSVLRHALHGLAGDGLPNGVETGPRVHQQLTALVVAACAEQNSSRRHGTAQVFLDARQYIQARLADPELGQESIASALNVSTRTLYRAFRAHDVTVSEWIRRQRLSHCRGDLEDARLAHVPVSALAAHWGLPDAAHFSRIFKSEFGISPKDYRDRSLRAAGSLAELEIAV